METIGYVEKFYIYKVASLPLEVTLSLWIFLTDGLESSFHVTNVAKIERNILSFPVPSSISNKF
jgi:hypothetical protein